MWCCWIFPGDNPSPTGQRRTSLHTRACLRAFVFLDFRLQINFRVADYSSGNYRMSYNDIDFLRYDWSALHLC
jgi:hypothetical protein